MKALKNKQNQMLMPLSLIAALLAGGCATTSEPESSTLANRQIPASINLKPEQVLATVNGHAIAKSAIPPHQQAPNQPTEEQLLDEVVARELIWQDFLTKDTSKDALTQEQLNNVLRAAYSQVAADHYMRSLTITDDELRKSYEQKKPNLVSKQFKLRHILLDDEASAKATLTRLAKGEKFGALVTKLSQDEGSKGKGGDLGWVDPRTLGPAFDHALANMNKGDVASQPIQTQYGWHVILLEDSRIQDAPAFEEIKGKLSANLRLEKFQDYIKTLKSKAKISKGGGGKALQAVEK